MQHRTGRASGQTIYQRLLINNIGVLDLRDLFPDILEEFHIVYTMIFLILRRE
ncbi:hypothetical protein RhiirA1_253631 [Rhizophagus irregularis]|uniref:Uncharacterized protein n=1 Tax=Rhizophagus irregularis TaxID=588596 RepID=A0A2N0SDE4_9GLOM|nr:hypothetical protein RhiirA1_253631 [Rhizophagus irregularis]